MTENNKVVYDGQTLIDLTQDDVTASDVRSGVYFHSADGVRGQGTLTSTSIPTADTIAEFDSSAHMNSTDMTSAEVSTFVGNLGYTFNLIDIFYPVGSYYETSDTDFDPNISWGGTWSLETEGQVHVSAGENYEVGDTGGSATVELDSTEIPAHTHGEKSLIGRFTGRRQGANYQSFWSEGICSTGSPSTKATSNGVGTSNQNTDQITINATHTHDTFGGDENGDTVPHNNMQPYIVVNRWHRTA